MNENISIANIFSYFSTDIDSTGHSEAKVEKIKVDRYEILGKVGEGAMGYVFKAYDTRLNRVVALKILKSKESDGAQKRFFREAKILAQLQHPNIVVLYEFGQIEDQLFFTMEYLEGEPLSDACNKNWPVSKILQIVVKIACALEYAHSKGICHRDIKPSNIFLCGQEPKVMDFGLAKNLNQESELSQDGSIIGTPLYMSPEQASGRIRNTDRRSDIYSLGCVLYELLTGRPPFMSKVYNRLIEKILNDLPLPPSHIRSSVSPELDAVCLKTLEKNKIFRYQNMKLLAEDLEMILQNKPTKVASIFFSQFYRYFRYYIIRKPLYFILIFLVMLVCSIYAYFSKEAPVTMSLEIAEKNISYQRIPFQIHLKNCGKSTLDFLRLQLLPSKGLYLYNTNVDLFHLSVGEMKVFHGWIYGDTKGIKNFQIVLYAREKEALQLSKAIYIEEGIYGFSFPIARSFMMDYKGEMILDTTSDAWQRLSPFEQARYATMYRDSYGLTKGYSLEKTIPHQGSPIEFSLIPPGCFWMGIEEQTAVKIRNLDPMNEWMKFLYPSHKVIVSKAYYLSSHEITQKQWEKIMKKNSSFFLDKSLPVTNISRLEAEEFCRKSGFQLPSESQWEYACRAGTTSTFYWGDQWMPDKANTASHWNKTPIWTSRDHIPEFQQRWLYLANLKPAKTFKANAFGLYDMIGNVCEWCQDDYYSYKNKMEIDPLYQNVSEKNGIRRGGSWWSPILQANCSYREPYSKTNSDIDTGFRVVIESLQKSQEK